MKTVTIDPRLEKSEKWRSKLRDFEAQLETILGKNSDAVEAEWTLDKSNGADALQLHLRDWSGEAKTIFDEKELEQDPKAGHLHLLSVWGDLLKQRSDKHYRDLFGDN